MKAALKIGKFYPLEVLKLRIGRSFEMFFLTSLRSQVWLTKTFLQTSKSTVRSTPYDPPLCPITAETNANELDPENSPLQTLFARRSPVFR
jgi:hypothetical protein